jgi:hypothetical protein
MDDLLGDLALAEFEAVFEDGQFMKVFAQEVAEGRG